MERHKEGSSLAQICFELGGMFRGMFRGGVLECSGYGGSRVQNVSRKERSATGEMLWGSRWQQTLTTKQKHGGSQTDRRADHRDSVDRPAQLAECRRERTSGGRWRHLEAVGRIDAPKAECSIGPDFQVPARKLTKISSQGVVVLQVCADRLQRSRVVSVGTCFRGVAL